MPSPSLITILSNGVPYNGLRILLICNIIFFAISARCMSSSFAFVLNVSL